MVKGGRSDARRNREQLLETAAAAFASGNDSVSLEAIARAAGVGIGTLYRHFPNREALVEGVFRTELAALSALAPELLKDHPPAAALRRWMDRYAEFVATKRGMAESLRAIFASGAVEPAQTRESIVAAVSCLLQAGIADGSLRSDVEPADVVMSLLGIFLTTTSREQSARMLDLLLDGLVTTR
jgi:AcrR family transcriptional regulator